MNNQTKTPGRKKKQFIEIRKVMKEKTKLS